MLMFATICFASLSSLLSDWGYSRFEPPIPHGEFGKLHSFYLWHFFDSIPGLKLNETLLWKEPFKHLDHLSGVLLLLFKVAVIVPVISAFISWFKEKEKKKDGTPNT